jgi:hypothetical protein
MDELFRLWANEDYAETCRVLGYPSVSPSFKHLAAADDDLETWEPTPQEVRAVLNAMAWLAVHRPLVYAAVGRRYKRWTFGRSQPGDDALLAQAVEIVQKKVRDTLA